MRSRVSLLVVGVSLITQVAVAAVEPPVTVSPGSATRTLIGDPCPSFSWGAVPGAKSYELVVYRLGEEGEEKPLLWETFAGSASSWTPSLDRCLERGGKYAWSVRFIGKKGSSEWSVPSLFEVAPGPSEVEFASALEVVREYLAQEASGSIGMSAGAAGSVSEGSATTPVAGSAGGLAPGPSPLPVAMGDSALQVNNSPVVTVATLAGALCSSTEVRFLDQGDGTVLDCNTGKMWLKDASCLGFGTWDNTGTSVFTLVADLNNTGVGTDFGCTDYTEGSYTDWQVPAETDLCGLWNGSCTGTSCCTASAGLVDTSFSNPTVGNASGDGQWAAEDAFVGVQSSKYWSATESNASSAWFVDLPNGDVFIAFKVNGFYVWPVRGGQ